MAQVRLMSDDPGEVPALLETLLPLLRGHAGLVVSGTRELGKRGPGDRVVFELLLAEPGPVTVEQDGPPARARRGLPNTR